MVDIPDLILSDPLYSAILIVILAIVAVVSRQCLGPEDDWLELKKQNLFRRLDPYTTELGYSLLVEKRVNEYVCSVTESPDFIEVALAGCNYDENDISNTKYRVLPDGSRQYNVGQMAFQVPDSDIQWHAYLFPGHGDFGCDIYQHGETSWDPTEGGTADGHLDSDYWEVRDPERILRDCLIRQDVEYEFDAEWVERMRE